MITGFGSVVIDILMLSSTEGITLYEKNLVSVQMLQVGGVIPTALLVLSRLGMTTQIHTSIGDDELGKALLSIFKKEGVGLGRIVPRLKKTPLACVVVNKDRGERTNFYTTGGFSAVDPKLFENTLGRDTELLLVDGHNIEGSKVLISQARKVGARVVLDLGNPKKGKETLIPLADVVVAPQTYCRLIWPDYEPKRIVQELLNKGVKIAVVTLGHGGSVIGQGDTIFHQPSYAVESVDTNGAGDVFLGTFVYGFLSGWSLQKTAKYASAAAAFSCTKIGKEEKIPRSIAQIEDFIKQH